MKLIVKRQLSIANVILAIVLGVFFLFFQTAAAQVFFSDPGFTTNTQDVDKQWGLAKARFIEAWGKTQGSESVVVAIIDTGVDATHEDLQSVNFVEGFNLLTHQAIIGKVNSDDNGHGTLVAGLLGATGNNQVGVVGTNWQISIMPIKALDQSGKGDTAKVAEGIIWAVDHGAQIINLSLGGIGFGHDSALSEAVAYAFRKNLVIVAAAGNDSQERSVNLDVNPVFPICEDNGLNMIIGVGAVDQNDVKTSFSNYGKNCIDVVAPGKRILSTINYDPITKIYSPNAYAYASGTSLATALVSGQAALLKARFPFASNIQIRDRIIASADQIDYLNLSQCGGGSCRGLLGAGRINVGKSLESSIFNQTLWEGDVARSEESGAVYLISGGKKQLISSFVFNQRFLGSPVKTVASAALEQFSEGPYAAPLENSLVKIEKDPTVYMIKRGLKFPILSTVFKQRGLRYSDINVVSVAELDSWITGSLLAPKEGTIVKNPSGRSLFWVLSETLRPINRQFIVDKGIQKFPQLILLDKDLNSFSKGEKLY